MSLFRFRPHDSLSIAGFLLIASGLFHWVVWILIGGDWEGAVSWRKPILFGFSSGLTLVSMAWIFPRLKPRQGDWLVCGSCAVAMVVEVALITMQQWRGQASHFNQSTSFDLFVGYWMTGLICVVTLAIVDFAWRSFRHFDGPDDLRLAVQGGMSLLLLSCLIGFAIFFYGEHQVQQGRDPSLYGSSGVTKFPHGIAIHAIQFLPCLSWLLSRIGIAEPNRFRLMGQSLASITALLIFGVIQTASGRSRFDIGYAGMFALIAASLLALPTMIHVVMGGGKWIWRRRSSASSIALRLMVALSAIGLGTRRCNAQDWHQWGGADRNFVLPGPTSLDATEPYSLREKWRMEIGAGNSGVCVRGHIGYTCFSCEGKELVVAFSTSDGNEIWRREFEVQPASYLDLEFGPGPHSTPLVTDKYLFFVGQTGHLVALDAVRGETLWERQLWASGEHTKLERGFAASPVAFNDSIILPVGGDNQSVQCFAMSDGAMRWSEHDYASAYSSPLIATVEGRVQAIVLMEQCLVGLDPATGDLLWEHPVPAIDYANCASPITGPDDLIYYSHRKGLRALKLSVENEQFRVDEVWASRIAIAQTANFVLLNGVIYGGKEGGVFAAVDALTGAVIFQSRKPGTCCTVVVGNRIATVRDDGVLQISSFSRNGIEPLWQCKVLDGRCWVGPTFCNGLLLVRDSRNLIALELE